MQIWSTKNLYPNYAFKYQKENQKESTNNNQSNKKTNTFDYLNAIGNYNICFCGKPAEPFYAVDMEGNYVRYTSKKEAIEKTGATNANIYKCLQNTRNISNGYFFFYAREVETKAQDGTYVLDMEALKKKIEEKKESLKTNKGQRAVYAIDINGKYSKHASIREAAKDLNVKASNISNCLCGDKTTAMGYGFLYADDVERTSKDGSISVDKRKILKKQEEIIEAKKRKPDAKAFYAIDEYGNYERFEKNSDASKKLGIYHTAITNCLTGERKTAKGFTFVYADEIESTDENGNVVVNVNISDDTFNNSTPVPIYAINNRGEIIKFNTIGSAARELNISSWNISNNLREVTETAGGYAFIRVDEAEIVNPDGTTSINHKKLAEKFYLTIKNDLYVVNKNGKYKRYTSAKDVAKALGVQDSAVSACANGLLNSIKNKAVIRARYVEIYDNGKITINEDILNQFANNLAKEINRPIYAIDEDNKRRRFINKESAAKVLGIDKKKIGNCLRGVQQTTGGYRFVYEDSMEKRTKETITKVYVIGRHGDYFEYDSLEAAAKKIDVELDELKEFLRKGRSNDNKMTLNGCVISTNLDEW